MLQTGTRILESTGSLIENLLLIICYTYRDMYIRLLVRKQADGSSLSPSISPEKPSAKSNCKHIDLPLSVLMFAGTSSQLTRTPLVATRKSTGATKLSVSPALTAISPALTAKPKVRMTSPCCDVIMCH